MGQELLRIYASSRPRPAVRRRGRGYDQHRTTRSAHDAFADATEQCAIQTAAPVRADDDYARLEPLCLGQDLFHRRPLDQ